MSFLKNYINEVPLILFSSDVLLSPSKWHHMHWSGDKATLTLTHLNKEDEGLYTLRVTTKSGYETYSAYVFVRGGYTFPKSHLVIKTYFTLT